MIGLDEDSESDEKKIVLYLLGISISHIALVGGALVFILIVLNIEKQALGGIFSAYLSLAISIATTFLYRPLKETGLKKFFTAGSAFFLLISAIFFLNYLGF